jgi:hypothetical protein
MFSDKVHVYSPLKIAKLTNLSKLQTRNKLSIKFVCITERSTTEIIVQQNHVNWSNVTKKMDGGSPKNF